MIFECTNIEEELKIIFLKNIKKFAIHPELGLPPVRLGHVPDALGFILERLRIFYLLPTDLAALECLFACLAHMLDDAECSSW